MFNKKSYFLWCLVFIYACHPSKVDKSTHKTEYLRHVGDIAFDASLDDPAFVVCNENTAMQYYNFGKWLMYKGEKPAIMAHFKNGFRAKKKSTGSGYVTIRFLVNCEGKTGRFRVQGMDEKYQSTTFSKDLTSQLLRLTKALDGWMPAEQDGKPYDYYQYLSFKIKNGQLTDILP